MVNFSKNKKYLVKIISVVLLLVILVLPTFASAAWWNPFSWNIWQKIVTIFQKPQVVQIQQENKTEETKVDETAGWKMYTNERYNYQINYPANFTIDNAPSGVANFFKKGEEYTTNVSVQVLDATQEQLLSLSRDLSTFNSCKKINIVLGNESLQATRCEVKEVPKQSPGGYVYEIIRGNYIFYITTNQFVAYDPLLDNMVKTLRFANTEVAGWKIYSGYGISFKYPSSWTYQWFNCNLEGVAFCPVKNGVTGCGQTCGMDSPESPIYFYASVFVDKSNFKLKDQEYKEVFDKMVASLDLKPVSSVEDWKTYTNTEYGFEVKYPAGFFYQDPKVLVGDCNYNVFPAQCPSISDIVVEAQIAKGGDATAVRNNMSFFPRGEKTTINNTSYCLYETGDPAAGSIYYDYYYATVKNQKCFIVNLKTRLTNCGVYGASGDKAYDDCTIYNTKTYQQKLDQILSAFKFIP